ncbi:hypothetical protein [Nitrosomonas sp.]|uniref:hypothetical protein n=1 Tax=Nitrosomonas sp. TaxID=42353 RepID=UPI00374CD269
MAAKKTGPAWSDVKGKLVNFDREGLLDLVHDLYSANKDNQIFLHARFNLGGDVLKPYKATINRWLWPDILKNQDYSVAKAKKAISDYKKAIGQAEGLAELMVYYCECVTGFSNNVGIEDESYLDALVRMFEQALKAVAALPEIQRDPLWTRLDAVRRVSHDNLGYGVGEDMDDLLAEYRVVG